MVTSPPGSSELCELLDLEGDVQDVAAFEIADVGDVPIAAGEIGQFVAEKVAHLADVPEKEFSFDAFAVGVLRRIESALIAAHLANDVIQGFARDAREEVRALARRAPARPHRLRPVSA